MNKPVLIFLVGIVVGLSVNAEVYRWVDKDGKVHYTDQKPANDAEDVTRQVNKQNIDSSTNEMRKVESILRKENDADREYYQQQAQEDAQARQQQCNWARKRMNEISGNVIFVDDAGKVVKVTETERQKMVADVSKIIQENCD